MKERIYYTTYASPVGALTLTSDGTSLTGLWTEHGKYAPDFSAGTASPQAPSNSHFAAGNTPPQASSTIDFAAENASPQAPSSSRFSGKMTSPARLPVFLQTTQWLDCYFRGENPRMDIPLAPSGSPFQHLVWDILLTIPYGETTTYGAIARQLEAATGKRAAAQAVGGAVGHNPIDILIPCHRVVGKSGSLTGYAGGLEVKTALLTLEGVDMTGFFLPGQ
ncbi:MAG: methylated-DNA--[protein]-cysteine S-methyltransferase [Roseburia sp.]|nr:methylated-DNA--[protein]-cysteine S-methyltransferase [Roseburia sp.]